MEKQWYFVQCQSGVENAVKKAIETRIMQAGKSEEFGQVVVPSEEVIELKAGVKKTTQRKLYPGYILVEMQMSEETWHLIKHTPRVSGFVGGTGLNPKPLTTAEITAIFNTIAKAAKAPTPKIVYNEGELIRVTSGPFAEFNGTIESLNYDKDKVVVAISVFGRSTNMELAFNQITKI